VQHPVCRPGPANAATNAALTSRAGGRQCDSVTRLAGGAGGEFGGACAVFLIQGASRLSEPGHIVGVDAWLCVSL
jgi:hypothetical protein